jgi:S1-C subfamily serine protease
MKSRTLLVTGLVVLVLSVSALRADAGEWGEKLEEKAKSVVFLKFVLQERINMGGQSRDRESRREALGVLIGADGLVLTANDHFDPEARFPRRMREQVEVSAVPTDLKVSFGSEELEYEARLVARDSSLGVAFVQILDLKGREVTPVDLSTGAAVETGQLLFSATRLPREFDCAPILCRLIVTGKVEKPRSMWAISGQLPAPALPLFNLDGVAVGIISLQEGSSERRSSRHPFLLPVKALAQSIEQAKKRIEEALGSEGEADEEEEKEKPGD